MSDRAFVENLMKEHSLKAVELASETLHQVKTYRHF